jgi:hypothetical protein
MDDPYAEAGLRLFEGLLARAHMARPAQVGALVAEELEAALSARGVAVFLVNLEETGLTPVPRSGHPDPGAQAIEGSMVGRSFTSSKVLSTPGAEPGHVRAFVPLIDGTDRLGVIEAELPVANVAGGSTDESSSAPSSSGRVRRTLCSASP